MPVNKYEAFLKAAELGSLTRAAAELGVTQSAVSHMIGALEEELGFSLLKRGRGGARATAEGEPGARLADPVGEERVQAEAHGRARA